jgi:hypothetical protein
VDSAGVRKRTLGGVPRPGFPRETALARLLQKALPMNLLLSPTAWRGAWRQLRGEPGPAALVILGLALGLALTLLTASFVRDTLWPDAALPKVDRLVTFEWQVRGPGGSTTEWFPDVPATPLHGALREAGAPVGPMTRVLAVPLPARAVDGQGVQHRARLTAALADPEIQTLFDLHPLAGDLRAALTRPEGLALTEDAALKLFGTTQVIGRPVTLAVTLYGDAAPQTGDVTLTVMALLPASSHNATLKFEALAGFSAPAAKAFVERESSWTFGAGRLFARLQPGATPASLSALAQQLLMRQPMPPGLPADFLKGGGPWARLRALPVTDIGLHGAGSPQRRLRLGGLAAAAAGVLALGAINFVNLWSVRTLRRQREIGLRKSLGADAWALAVQFFIETLAVTLLAGALGLLFAWWGTPLLGLLLQHGFDTPVLAPGMVALAVLLCLLIAAFSALPLALIALRVRAAESLAGRSHSEGAAGRWLRRAMTTLQFGAAVLFTAMAVVVLWQARHASHVDRGFEAQDRLAVDLPWETQPAQTRAMLARIQAWPEVVGAGASDDVPGRDFGNWYSEFRGPGGDAINLRTGLGFTPGLLNVYGMRLLAGRLSVDHVAEAAQHAVVLDRSAARVLGFASPEAAVGQSLGVNSQFGDGKPVTVVAVIADIRLEGPRSAHLPNVLSPVVERGGCVITVHSRSPAETRRKLTALVEEVFPDQPAEVLSVAEQQGRSVAGDVRLGQLIAATSALALLLAAVGIYALAAYTLRRREREIVLRKLHGAGHGAVARLLAREFAAVAGVACVVALPAAAWLAEGYLSVFVERAPMGPFGLGPLLVAALALLAVTALAVLRHLLAAFALRPSQALQG